MKKVLFSLLIITATVFLYQSAKAVASLDGGGVCVTTVSGKVTGECFTSAAGTKRCIKTTAVDCAGVIIVHELE